MSAWWTEEDGGTTDGSVGGPRGGRRRDGRRAPDEAGRGLRLRRRTLRRWTLPALAWAALLLSMASAVRRGSQARDLSLQIEAMRRAEDVARERVADAVRRADSLASRSRIRRVAAEQGLRPTTDAEITFLEDAVPPVEVRP